MLLLLVKKFFLIGLFSFGGGYAMLPLFEKEFIKTGIINYDRFMEIMTISQMTPGSFAINAATFIGKEKVGFMGALLSTIAVSIPSLIILIVFSKILLKYKDNPIKKRIFDGLSPAVMGFILAAVFMLAGSEAMNIKYISLFLMSMLLLFTKKVHPIAVIFIIGGINILL